jgi:hypothetical protein
MEGISNEAASLADHWGLGKLIALYDNNHISIDGNTSIALIDNVSACFEPLDGIPSGLRMVSLTMILFMPLLRRPNLSLTSQP